jgi:hypothetical protein
LTLDTRLAAEGFDFPQSGATTEAALTAAGEFDMNHEA